MHSTKRTEEIHFKTNDPPIKLGHDKTESYVNTSEYDKNVLGISYTWHRITVHHNGKFNKKQILDALFEIIEDSEFYPIAYRKYDLFDNFLIRQCREAIQKLFAKRLRIQMDNGQIVQLTLELNVAEYIFGQIYAMKKIEKVVTKKFGQLETIGNIPNVLNLEKFADDPELEEIIINLNNKTALLALCKVIAQNHDILNNIQGIKLSNNNINSLGSFVLFNKATFKIFDIRHNNINQINQFKNFKCLDINELHVIGNPFTQKLDYIEELKKMLPNILKIDGIHTKKTTETQMADTIEMTFAGEIISSQNPRDNLYFKKYKSSEKWHQVIINHQGKYTKSEILKALFSNLATQISSLYPCYYTIGSQEDIFFVRQSFEHLEIIYSNGMAIQMPQEKLPVIFKMNVANFKTGQIEPTDLIAQATKERFNLMDRFLNLENLSSSKCLKNMELYLCNPRTLSAIIAQSARICGTHVVELRLGHNEIISGKGLHSLTWMKNLKVLDLSHNLIENISDLDMIPKIAIKELCLDGNPLCKNYALASEYIKDVKTLFPDLIKLDGIPFSNGGSMAIQKNYLCSLEAYDFVEQFITNYFSMYDSAQRVQLVDMYHSEAILSLSCSIDKNKIKSYNAERIHKYISKSRNIKSFSNYDRAFASIYMGKEQIGSLFKYFAQTEHDMFSFTVDNTIFTRPLICITIGGIFQESGSNLLEKNLLLSFSRTFILHPVHFGLGLFKNTTEYKIVNEQLHISFPTILQTKNSFKYSKPIDTINHVANSAEEKESFTIMFQQMTGLKSIWCTRCFTDGNWNFRKALEVFVELSKTNQIPQSAFVEEHQIK